MVMGSLAALNFGGTAVYPCEGFNPKETLKAIDHYGLDTAYGVPSMFIAMLKEYKDHKDRYNVKSLTKGIMAGSICPEELMRNCNDVMGIDFVSIAYGMTETSPVSFQCRKDDPFEKRTTTVGKIHPHVEVKIVDENGKVVKRGEKGEICTRGYSVMLKYWNDHEKTKETIDDEGWVHSGDLGVLDDEGYLEIVGRVKDMIIRGGENIFPKEIENHLLTHPDILDAQVIGVEDQKMGEEIMACIIIENPDKLVTRSDIKDYCQGEIAHFKIPRYVRIVSEYPLTVTGKVRKNEMRAEANKILKEVSPSLWEVDHNIYV
jgi:fatty-acyl-CoA synthase